MLPSLAVIGLGLMGASVLRASQHFGIAKHHIGVDPSPEILARCRALNLFHAYAPNAGEAAAPTLAVVAAPVGRIASQVIAALDAWPAAVITDLGSTKGSIVREVAAARPAQAHRYIPAHPYAGSEKSGPEYGIPSLFVGKKVFICPVDATSPEYALVKRFWEACGATIENMDAEQHDRIFGFTSHLVQAISFAFRDALESTHGQQAVPALSDASCEGQHARSGSENKWPPAPPLADSLYRLASSSRSMWDDIFRHNTIHLNAIAEIYLQALHALPLDAESLTTQLKEASSSAPDTHEQLLPQTEYAVERVIFPVILALALRQTVAEATTKHGIPYASYTGSGYASFNASLHKPWLQEALRLLSAEPQSACQTLSAQRSAFEAALRRITEL